MPKPSVPVHAFSLQLPRPSELGVPDGRPLLPGACQKELASPQGPQGLGGQSPEGLKTNKDTDPSPHHVSGHT